MPVLDAIEAIESDSQDKPKSEIVIEDTIVMENPFRDAIAEILLKQWKVLAREKDDVKWTSLSTKAPTASTAASIIGKYMKK